ncbi:PMEI domain-containing protein [Heracleum sosnowskyi]|uniref:PMEI domain-containing protein n=1 Tax=Heracleum sosnowskyi TaxID=360622 RepID=A0AAD8IFZ5_9APIA|nr:PMEI domain-containing protein [Heracleum sosnowskyi]
MASNINQVVLIVSMASLLALFPQAKSTAISKAPAPVDVKAQMNRFIKSTMAIGMQKTREYLQGIEMQVNDPATSETTLGCLKACKDVYEAALDDMKKTIEDVESENYYKVNMDISSISTNIDTCSTYYRETTGEDLEVKKFSDWVMEITNDCLDRLETITS